MRENIQLLKSEILSVYKSKVFLTGMVLVILFVLLAPANLVFSENIKELLGTKLTTFRSILAVLIAIEIPLLIVLIRTLKKIWDSFVNEINLYRKYKENKKLLNQED
ncbi:hypothetical protein [Calidifontibacillus erzurumensis]|uniref:hypothetical protein n=1 Tax=Calidifontibacillus erzurumensis TaxID=2741433 RepID=UPI0035B56AF0